MRTETKTVTYYQFAELSEEAQDKAIESCSTFNVDHEWWDFIYEDAARIGLEISEFDIDRSNKIAGSLTKTPVDVCKAILAEHGDSCDTYQLAKTTLPKLEELQSKFDDEEACDEMDVRDYRKLEEDLEELKTDFEQELLEEYFSILRKEYNYLTSREAIIESIEANEYEFDENGEMF